MFRAEFAFSNRLKGKVYLSICDTVLNPVFTKLMKWYHKDLIVLPPLF